MRPNRRKGWLERRLCVIPFSEWRGSVDGRVTIWVERLAAWRGWALDLHKIVRPDDADCFHTHPAWAVRIILVGGYVEQLEDGRWRMWSPGRIGVVRPGLSHRIGGLRNGAVSYSLWLRGPKCAAIQLRGPGWAKAGPDFTPAMGAKVRP